MATPRPTAYSVASGEGVYAGIARAVPAWRPAAAAGIWIQVPLAVTFDDLSPHLVPASNPNYPSGWPEYMGEGISYHRARMAAWNGATYDKLRSFMYFWPAGGHADYAGTDIIRLVAWADVPYFERIRESVGSDGLIVTNDAARFVSGIGTTCTLPTGSQAPLIYPGVRDEPSAVDGFYNGMVIDAQPQPQQTITAYNGTTKVCTISPGYPVEMAGRTFGISNGPMVYGANGEKTGRYAVVASAVGSGNFRSIHDYNNNSCNYVQQKLYVAVGGSGYSWSASQGNYIGCGVDILTGAETILPAASSEQGASPFGGATCLDLTRGAEGSIWYIGQYANTICRRDCATGAITTEGTYAAQRAGYQTMVMLTEHDLILIAGSAAPQWAIFDPVAATMTDITANVSGTPVGGNTAFGEASLQEVLDDGSVIWWDSPSGHTTKHNRMAIPANPKTDPWVIEVVEPDPSNTVTPDARQTWGTYGRAQYDPRLKGFFVANRSDGGVYFYAMFPIT